MDKFHPGKKTLIFSVLFALLSTKKGRNLAAEIIHKHIKGTVLFWLPLSFRCKIVLFGMNLPVYKSRLFLSSATQPWGAQWDYITKITKNQWSGHWIVPESDKQKKTKRLQWVEETAKDADIIIYYMHGGAYRVGHSLIYTDSYIEIIENLKSKGKQARMFSIDYNMAPEVNFSRTSADALGGYRYLVDELKIHPKRIVLMGDSAGGNLVSNCLVRIRDSIDLEQPAGNVQISPWANIDSSQTMREGVKYQDCLNKKTLHGFDYTQYFPTLEACTNEADKLLALHDPSISPLFGSFVGICPTLVTYGGTEILQHDIQALIECYKRDKVKVEVFTRKAPHIWIILNVLSPSYKIWKEDCDFLANWCMNVCM